MTSVPALPIGQAHRRIGRHWLAAAQKSLVRLGLFGDLRRVPHRGQLLAPTKWQIVGSLGQLGAGGDSRLVITIRSDGWTGPENEQD